MWIWWAPLAAACLHITEEFFWPGGFGAWDRIYRPAFRQSITPRLHVGVNLLLLFLCVSVALAPLGPGAVTIGGVGLRSFIPQAFAPAAWLVLAGLLAGNAAFHVVGTVRTRRYSPGVVTGVALYVPIAVVGTWQFIAAGRLTPWPAAACLLGGAWYPLGSTLMHRMRSRGPATS